jgi:tight adherence protein C
MLQRVGQAAAAPFMPSNREKQSTLRRNLGYAGIYSAGAIKVISGFKVILLVGGILGGYAFGMATNQLLLGLSVGGLVGYVAPTMWLRQRIKKNQKALQYGLADGLDLMVVCVEAGLTVDAAMQRVGQELMIAHPAISREFAITYMETRVGLARGDALKNLGTRTGNAPLQSLASMLTQADRFGTSIANALRIHADTLRVARQQAAEELAAKASVKMSFPLVLFIFPATFIVLAGPTVIGLMNSGML